MKLFIVHTFKTYNSTGESYASATVFPTRESAVSEINAYIADDIETDMIGSEENTEQEKKEIISLCTKKAWEEGDNTESHDAILQYGDFTSYYNITEIYRRFDYE